jgi:hypothetical protein
VTVLCGGIGLRILARAARGRKPGGLNESSVLVERCITSLAVQVCLLMP